MLWVVGVVADLLSVNRSLLEELQVSQRARDWSPSSSNSEEINHD